MFVFKPTVKDKIIKFYREHLEEMKQCSWDFDGFWRKK